MIKTQKRLHFWELPDTIRIKLNTNYCEDMFRDLLKKFDSKEIAKKLNISKSYAYHLKNNMYSLKPSKLVIISRMLSKNLGRMERNIESINTTRGSITKFKFPIVANEEIASLIGHCFGDGSIFTIFMESKWR